jgi:hypothetical protein
MTRPASAAGQRLSGSCCFVGRGGFRREGGHSRGARQRSDLRVCGGRGADRSGVTAPSHRQRDVQSIILAGVPANLCVEPPAPRHRNRLDVRVVGDGTACPGRATEAAQVDFGRLRSGRPARLSRAVLVPPQLAQVKADATGVRAMQWSRVRPDVTGSRPAYGQGHQRHQGTDGRPPQVLRVRDVDGRTLRAGLVSVVSS